MIKEQIDVPKVFDSVLIDVAYWLQSTNGLRDMTLTCVVLVVASKNARGGGGGMFQIFFFC